jgi:hypothetical protein
MAVATVRNGVIVYSGVGLKDRRTLTLPEPVSRSAGPVIGGKRLIVAGESGTIHELGLKAAGPLVPPIKHGYQGLHGYASAFSLSGKYAAFSHGYDLDVFDVAAGRRERIEGVPGQHVVKAGAFSPDDRLLAVTRDGELALFDPATRSRVARLDGGKARPWCLAFSDDGRLLFEGLGDGRVRAWDVPSGALWREWAVGSWVMSLGVRGRRVIAGCHDGTAAVWEVEPPLPTRRPPTPAEVRRWWNDLGDANPRVGRLAARRLAARPDVALRIIAGWLRVPAGGGEERRFGRALLALELMGTPAARRVLERLAKAAPRRADLKAAISRTLGE